MNGTMAEAGSLRLRGILLMISAFAVFSCLDTAAKVLGESYPVPMVVFARYIGALLLSVIPVVITAGFGSFRTKRPGLQISRSVLLIAGTSMNFTALTFLPLAQTSSIMFAAPLVVCALSVPLLGEKVGPRRWAAVVIGFIGVLIIIRPGTGGFHWAAMLSVGATICTAVYQIATRKVAASDSAETTLIYTSLVGSALIAPVTPFHWVMPDLPAAGLMVFLGICGAFGHYLLIRAHHLAPAPTLAPFSYTAILWMTLLGFIVFGDVPSLWTLLGGTVVVGSGIYVLHRERKLEKQVASAGQHH